MARRPAGAPFRLALGIPDAGHPLYVTTGAAFVLIFGVGYAWAGVMGWTDRLFAAVAAAGKLTFFGLLVSYWATGDLPIIAPVAGVGDLLFGALFTAWLLTAWRHNGPWPPLNHDRARRPRGNSSATA